jgi:hypothetical protein
MNDYARIDRCIFINHPRRWALRRIIHNALWALAQARAHGN